MLNYSFLKISKYGLVDQIRWLLLDLRFAVASLVSGPETEKLSSSSIELQS